ncbi:MAG: SDR family NAD(P)-dependent oxidoreductase, partial [Acidimicrobiia bacterium]|nr:SDR family NAD(P)-dependent oxidoreductase [Acidimicrobiia bacterium]MDX2468122.1 SDR family NAD(P)-dependent oxidoreductase [Acidimicrobiia bacterium]
SQPEELLTDAMPLIVAFEEYGRVYRDDIGTSYLFDQRDLGGLLDIVMENRGTVGPVKFAEVGAGTGGLTTRILPKLHNIDDQYWITDISSGFFDKLNQQFRPYQGVARYCPWDIVQPKPAAIDEKLDLILGSNVLHATSNIRAALSNISDALDDGGFLLLHEVTDGFAAVVGLWGFLTELWDFNDPEVRDHGPILSNEAWPALLSECGFEVVAQRTDGSMHTIFLCKKMTAPLPSETPIFFSDDAIGELQSALDQAAVERDRVVWAVGDHLGTPGLAGLSNCVRREPDGDLLRTAFIDTDYTNGVQRAGDLTDAEWTELRRRDLAMNVYKDGVWGSYRAIPLEPKRQRAHDHITLNIDFAGDLSSLYWCDAPKHRAEDFICDVHYTSLNFKDVMIATNKISAADLGGSAWRAFLGEFAGVMPDGRRVMGCGGDAFSNRSYRTLGSMPDVWTVPDHWSLADAATVPIVYSTIYLGLVMRAGLQRGQRILIHSGSGGIGQAAIHVARSFGCEIFTTVGTDEKRAFVRELFPDIADSHIGSSRDTTFEDMVLDATDGEGVHIVLNALADDKLQASLRVLARYGQFVEIGKFDMVANTPIGMKMFLREVSVHGVGLDNYLADGNDTVLGQIAELVREGIDNGAVVPLTHTIFPKDEVESAFRYMAQGKHVGKVLLDMRPSEEKPYRSRPHFWADPDKSYLITGGLGGFGFELAGWLVDRGARYVTLAGRSGIKNGYQHYHIGQWRKRGVTIDVTQADVTTEEGTRQLLEQAQVSAPLGGIFHLAMILKDSLWTNQTQERFDEVVQVKKKGSEHLDAASRELCPALDHFVMFSSLVGGWGNAGQTSYAYGNAAMDRLCERRKKEGLPAVSIQWGPVGDVGFVSENRDYVSVESVNMREQSLRSCLSVLDNYLLQDEPVVLSVVMPTRATVADAGADATASGERTLDSLFLDVRTILGIPEGDVISDETTFVDLGIDSLMTVELTSKLQKDYGLRMSLAKSRALSMGQLRDLFNASSLADRGAAPDAESSDTVSADADSGIFVTIRAAENPPEALYFVGGFATEPMIAVQEIPQPPEGSVTVVRFENSPSMDVLAEAWVDHIAALPASAKTVRMVGHSTGALIVHRLQAHLEAPEVRARLGKRQIHSTTVSPPRADVFWPLRDITADELNRASKRAVVEHVRANPLFEQVDLMEPEKVRAQVRFIVADHFYDKRMGKVDVTVLPSEDPLAWSGDDAAGYAADIQIVAGTHDLRGIHLDEVFASGVPRA